MMVQSAVAGPTVYSDPLDLFDYRFEWLHDDDLLYEHDNPAEIPSGGPFTPEEYILAVESGQICGVTLTTTVDDLDKNDSVKVYVQDQTQDWHFLGNLNTMNFSDIFGHVDGPGAMPGHSTTTEFPIEPEWLDGLPVNLKLSGWLLNPNGVEIETSQLDVCVIPAPAGILLGSIGIVITGWLRQRKRI